MRQKANLETTILAQRILKTNYNLTATVYSIRELTPEALDANLFIFEHLVREQERFENICNQCFISYLPTYPIYKTSNKGSLTLQTLLDIAKHAVNVADCLGFNVGEISSAITGLKVVNRVCTGEKVSKNDISLTVELISEYSKYYAKSEDEKKKITITSTMFSLAIEFLKRG